MAETKSAIIHLVCGATGAGKTTYAKKICGELGLARFSVDDWMLDLFGPDLPDMTDWAWISERAHRCETRILLTALDLAACGMSSVLEIGLAQATRRAQIVNDIRQSGSSFQFHYLDIDSAERWRRVDARNRAAVRSSGLVVPRAIFAFFEGRWEAPSEIELAALNGNIVG